MPVFSIATNLSKEKIGDKFAKETSAFIAKLLGKPESYVGVHVVPDQIMIFGGSNEPCAQVSLFSIGVVGGDKNKELSKSISEHLKKVGIAPNRCYIKFIDVDPSDLGFNGDTFA